MIYFFLFKFTNENKILFTSIKLFFRIFFHSWKSDREVKQWLKFSYIHFNLQFTYRVLHLLILFSYSCRKFERIFVSSLGLEFFVERTNTEMRPNFKRKVCLMQLTIIIYDILLISNNFMYNIDYEMFSFNVSWEWRLRSLRLFTKPQSSSWIHFLLFKKL